MRLVVQRVSRANVSVGEQTVGTIEAGLVVLIGAGIDDSAELAARMARKTAELRIFPDAEGRFNRSLVETGGEALVVSQFTLYGDTRRGRRPSFSGAAPPEIAEPLIEAYAAELQALG